MWACGPAVAGGRVPRPLMVLSRLSPLQVVRVLLSPGSRTTRRCRWSRSSSFVVLARLSPLPAARVLFLLSTSRCSRWLCSAFGCCSRRCRCSAFGFSCGSRSARRGGWSCSVSFWCSRAGLVVAGGPRSASPWACAQLAVAGGLVRRLSVALAQFLPFQVVRILLPLGSAHVSPLQVVAFCVFRLLSRSYRRCKWSALCFN